MGFQGDDVEFDAAQIYYQIKFNKVLGTFFLGHHSRLLLACGV